MTVGKWWLLFYITLELMQWIWLKTSQIQSCLPISWPKYFTVRLFIQIFLLLEYNFMAYFTLKILKPLFIKNKNKNFIFIETPSVYACTNNQNNLLCTT